MNIGKIIVDDLVPILVIMALGWCLGWKWKGQKRPFIDNNGRQALNYFVLDVALPAALFASIAKASRKLFIKDGVLTLISFIGVTALFMVCYYLDKWLFKRNKAEAAICALIAGSPTIGFLGFAVLDPIFGDTTNTNLVIGIISIVVNAITIPIGVSLVESYLNEEKAKNGTLKEYNEKGKKIHRGAGWSILRACCKPVAAAPILAVIWVLVGIPWPSWLTPNFELIAKANSGVAVLAAGVALAATGTFAFSWEIIWNVFYRLLLMPGILVFIGFLCGMWRHPDSLILLEMLALGTGLPPAMSGVIISSQNNIYVKEGTSTLAISTVCFAGTCVLWIWLIPLISHAL